MNPYERGTLEQILDNSIENFTGGLANSFEEEEIVEKGQNLTQLGRSFFIGLLAGVLVSSRALGENEPLTDEDIETIVEIVDRREGDIAKHLYR